MNFDIHERTSGVNLCLSQAEMGPICITFYVFDPSIKRKIGEKSALPRVGHDIEAEFTRAEEATWIGHDTVLTASQC